MAFLEDGKRRAMKMLMETPKDADLYCGSVADQDVWLGLGWLVGKQLATYGGDHCFCLTEIGRAFTKKYLEES